MYVNSNLIKRFAFELRWPSYPSCYKMDAIKPIMSILQELHQRV